MVDRQEQQKLIITAVIALIVTGLVAFYYFGFDKIEKEINRGYSKEAQRNPMLAAGLYLQNQNIDSDYSIRFTLFDRLGSSDTDSSDTIAPPRFHCDDEQPRHTARRALS